MNCPGAIIWTIIHVRTEDNYMVVVAQHIINANVRSLPWIEGRGGVICKCLRKGKNKEKKRLLEFITLNVCLQRRMNSWLGPAVCFSPDRNWHVDFKPTCRFEFSFTLSFIPSWDIQIQTRPDSLCRLVCPEVLNPSVKYTNTLLYSVLSHE